ncbi:NF041680 family putative transposase [Nocardia sp. CA-084685]|uniref:NF041680 family putative transposase n=1 Tax=Nocardia sp. CA-084685 TaxID=3239970 RepID=UPI003D98EDC6
MSSVESTRSFDLDCLAVFRNSFYDCLERRSDALFELTEAVLCSDGPVHTLVGLSLAAEHRRGHGALYDGLGSGRIDFARLRRSVAGLPVPRDGDGRILLAVDVSPWLRPDAATSPDRAFCHVYGRGKGQAQMIPGWPYSFVAALEPGRTSWTAMLDAVRIDPDDDLTTVTSTQIREVVDRLRLAGQHQPHDPAILIVFDAGYDITRLAYLLVDLPVELVGRIRSDRVLALPAAARPAARTGRPAKHGPEFVLADATTYPKPQVSTHTDTDRYGLAEASAWHRLHPMLKHRGNWADHAGPLPTIEGTLLRLRVQYLPGDRNPKPVWLWCSNPDATATEVDRYWRTFLRRFDIEHTFRFFKQTLGWTRPHLRDPHAADRWTWLVIAAHTQLRLARNLTHDLRRPWEKPASRPDRLTPARVRRGFRNLRPTTALPARAPKPSRPGPGRPPGSKNKQPAPHQPVGKNATTPTSTAGGG